MKRFSIPVFFCLILGLASGVGYAKSSSELGIVLGNPSGFSGKFFVSEKNAVDVVVGLGKGMTVHADYLWHDFQALRVNEGQMPLYYGAGFLVAEKDFCVQGKIGLEYLFETNPLGIFIEVAPAIGTEFRFQGGVGVRYRLQ